MGTRGRMSAAHAGSAVVRAEFGGKRPDPPPELRPRQQEIWVETCAAEPVGFFTAGAGFALLADYCAHREAAERLTKMVDAFDEAQLGSPDGLRRYNQLLKMRELETRGAAHLATKLRLTNQSRYRQQSPGRSAVGPKPWEA